MLGGGVLGGCVVGRLGFILGGGGGDRLGSGLILGGTWSFFVSGPREPLCNGVGGFGGGGGGGGVGGEENRVVERGDSVESIVLTDVAVAWSSNRSQTWRDQS